MYNQSIGLSSPQAPTSTFFNHAAALLAWCLPVLLLTSRTMADLSVVVVTILFLIKSSVEKEWAWAQTTWLKWASLFIAYLLFVNTPLSMSPMNSLNYSLFFMRWPLFAVALSVWLLNSAQRQRHFLISLACVMLFIIVDTWLQYVTGLDSLGHTVFPNHRLTGPFPGPIIGIMLVRILFLLLCAVFVFKRLQSIHHRFFFVFSVLTIGMLTIFISGERMAFILCSAGMSMIALGFAFQSKRLRRPILLASISAVGLLGIATTQLPNLSERMLHNMLDKLQHFATSDYGIVFSAAWHAWQKNPIVGSGLHTYKQHCLQTGVLENTGFNCTHPHNLYLQIGTETGWLGILLFVCMIVSLYAYVIRPHVATKNWLSVALTFTMLSVSFWPLIGGISLLNNWVAALAWLGAGWALALVPTEKNEPLI